MGAFLDHVQPGPFQVQAQRLIRMFCQVFAHDADTLFHQVIAAGDQRWQIAGAARFLVGFLHDFQRFNRYRLCGIVKLDTAAAVELYVDETGGDYCSIEGTLFDLRRQFRQRANTFNQAISDYNRMVIQNFMAGINPTVG